MALWTGHALFVNQLFLIEFNNGRYRPLLKAQSRWQMLRQLVGARGLQTTLPEVTRPRTTGNLPALGLHRSRFNNGKCRVSPCDRTIANGTEPLQMPRQGVVPLGGCAGGKPTLHGRATTHPRPAIPNSTAPVVTVTPQGLGTSIA